MSNVVPEVKNPTPGHCLDCKAAVITGELDGEFTIIHSGNGCDGFRRRFSGPADHTTRGITEHGEEVTRAAPSKKPAKLEGGKEDKK